VDTETDADLLFLMNHPTSDFFAPHLHPRLFAHRGASGHCPENSLPAFALALELGAPYLELDVRMSRDGHVMVHHDETVARTTEGSGAVGEMTLEALRALDAGHWFRRNGEEVYPFRGQGIAIPTLGEVLRAFPLALLNIEVKQETPPMEGALERVLVRHGALGRVLLTAESGGTMRRIRARLGDRVATGISAPEGADLAQWILGGRTGRPRPAGQALQIPERLAGREYITAQFVEAVHGIGLEVHVWTVNDPQRMGDLLGMGVDGIMTDFPERFPKRARRGS
jgi:glycerophosphoryl diester phosphodiesterase